MKNVYLFAAGLCLLVGHGCIVTKVSKRKSLAKQELAQQRQAHESVCGRCYDALANHWHYHKEKKTYAFEDAPLEIVKDVVRGTVTCIEGLSPDAIEELLGKPTKKTKQYWFYCRGYPCFIEGDMRQENHFTVEFDTITGKAKRFYVG